MTSIVSTFLDTDLGKGKYLFFLVTWNDFVSRISDELDKQWSHFGEALGVDGTAIRAFNKAKNKTYDEIQSKSWPPEIRERMFREQDPYMLIIDNTFDNFDPHLNKWSVIWFSEFYERPGAIDRLFGALANKVRRGEDIFEWAASLSKKKQYSKFSKYFEIKPGIFGVTLNVKSALED